MPNYQTPGVYIQEIESGSKPLEAVSTSNAGFIGVIPISAFSEIRWNNTRGEEQLKRLPGSVVADDKSKVDDVDKLVTGLGLDKGEVTDLNAFGALYGVKPKVTVKDDKATIEFGKAKVETSSASVDAAGKVLVKDRTKVASLIDELTTKAALTKFSPSTVGEVVGAFGGTDVKVAGGLTRFAVGPTKVTNPTQFNNFMRKFFETLQIELYGNTALRKDPEALESAYLKFLNVKEVFNFVMSVSGFFKNGGGIAYPYLLCAESSDIPLVNPAKPRDGLGAFDDLENDLQILAGPGLTHNQQKEILEYCEQRFDVFAIIDGPKDRMQGEDIEKKGLLPASDKGFAAMYVPWVTVSNPFNDKAKSFPTEVIVPPSGFIAGVYARVDGQRGVHKAPANETVAGITGLAYSINAREQAAFNVRGINCIRDFGGRGVRIWGARTLSTLSNPSWKYINVRRLFIMIEKTIQLGSQWAVFEPNDHRLWARLKRNIYAFLLRVWSSGALVGRTAEEAFYVKCDEETNPKEEVDAGYVNVEIGIAPVKPAEFVVFKIGQWDGGARVTE
jgi:phage tail sheath protein FI